MSLPPDHWNPKTDSVRTQLLVMRCQDGESVAMAELVDRWHQRFWRHARRLTDSDDDASEIMQNAWLGIIKTIGRLDDPARFPYWAYRIVTNKSADFVRQRVRQKEKTQPLGEIEPVAPVESTPDDSLKRMLSKLSLEHRTVISLRYAEELSLEEIALSLDLPLGTVKSRIHYALKTLQTLCDHRVSDFRK
ncbi:MAG: RNA polymerase sigma factor [Planctomycetaceae bacterium]|nr:RNA polymerase sigma factor [Planctomycetaceae bacterium]